MKKHWRYASYIIRHKWFVFLAGMRTGAPLWRLVIHDWSKLLPCEWIPYVEKFYGLKRYDVGSTDPRETQRREVDDPFSFAWLHHQHCNPHHWQYWVLRNDDGTTVALKMPTHFVREMVADWLGAGRAITGKWGVSEWYAKNRDKMIIHDDTRPFIEKIIREYDKQEVK